MKNAPKKIKLHFGMRNPLTIGMHALGRTATGIAALALGSAAALLKVSFDLAANSFNKLADLTMKATLLVGNEIYEINPKFMERVREYCHEQFSNTANFLDRNIGKSGAFYACAVGIPTLWGAPWVMFGIGVATQTPALSALSWMLAGAFKVPMALIGASCSYKAAHSNEFAKIQTSAQTILWFVGKTQDLEDEFDYDARYLIHGIEDHTFRFRFNKVYHRCVDFLMRKTEITQLPEAPDYDALMLPLVNSDRFIDDDHCIYEANPATSVVKFEIIEKSLVPVWVVSNTIPENRALADENTPKPLHLTCECLD